MVGKAIASKLIEVGHEVRMGSRTADNPAATEWAAAHGDRASHGTFADAAAFGEAVFQCAKGEHAVAVVTAAGAENLAAKVLFELGNPLDFSQGFPPRLWVCNDDSLGEQVQRAVPTAKVVKTLNTLGNELMVDPASLGGGDHTIFVAGNDAGAKEQAAAWLGEWFGHGDILDVGDISAARGLEAWLLLWTRMYGALGTANFQIKVVRG